MYDTVTELSPTDTDVTSWLSCTRSMSSAPDGPTLSPLAVPAAAPVNVTLPKSAKGTSPSSVLKSSTIHSASYWHSAVWSENVYETVSPVESFVTSAVPPVVDDAVTVTVTESPAEKLIPEKSYA